jgi:hypothetical protein
MATLARYRSRLASRQISPLSRLHALVCASRYSLSAARRARCTCVAREANTWKAPRSSIAGAECSRHPRRAAELVVDSLRHGERRERNSASTARRYFYFRVSRRQSVIVRATNSKHDAPRHPSRVSFVSSQGSASARVALIRSPLRSVRIRGDSWRGSKKNPHQQASRGSQFSKSHKINYLVNTREIFVNISCKPRGGDRA